VQFLGDLAPVRLLADQGARADGQDQPLVPVAIALFLLVAGEGSLLRLTGRLRGGPSGVG
jgi:hypothetical protein